jgi:hypothetical protein
MSIPMVNLCGTQHGTKSIEVVQKKPSLWRHVSCRRIMRVMTPLSAHARQSLEPLKDEIVPLFSTYDWRALGVDTGCDDIVEGDPRLFRSMGFGDADYPDCVFDVLIRMARRSEANLNLVRQRIDKARATKGLNVSSFPQPEAPALVFTPSVFSIPHAEPNQELVAIMMPFDAWFTLVAETIKQVRQRTVYAVGGETIYGTTVW